MTEAMFHQVPAGVLRRVGFPESECDRHPGGRFYGIVQDAAPVLPSAEGLAGRPAPSRQPEKAAAKPTGLSPERAQFWMSEIAAVLEKIIDGIRAELEGAKKPQSTVKPQQSASDLPFNAPGGHVERTTGDAASSLAGAIFSDPQWIPPAPGSLEEHFLEVAGRDPRTGRARR